VIVVTGPGRSGTSFLAALYRELGFDPGGRWESHVRAGLEHRDVVALNLIVGRALGVSVDLRRGGTVLKGLGALENVSDGRVSPGLREPFTAVVDALRYHHDRPDLMDWSSLSRVAGRYGEAMRTLARDRSVVKDPRFCWTLGAWLASDVPVEAVVLAIRPLDAMTDSRVQAGMYTPRARDWARHNYCYGLGLVMTTAVQYRLPLTTLRFPDFLEQPDTLYDMLPLPEPRTRQEFHDAFAAVFDPALVHDTR
jgi:hypothetical protein